MEDHDFLPTNTSVTVEINPKKYNVVLSDEWMGLEYVILSEKMGRGYYFAVKTQIRGSYNNSKTAESAAKSYIENKVMMLKNSVKGSNMASLTKEGVIKFLQDAGIWVKDEKIKKSDYDKAMSVLRNNSTAMINSTDGNSAMGVTYNFFAKVLEKAVVELNKEDKIGEIVTDSKISDSMGHIVVEVKGYNSSDFEFIMLYSLMIKANGKIEYGFSVNRPDANEYYDNGDIQFDQPFTVKNFHKLIMSQLK